MKHSRLLFALVILTLPLSCLAATLTGTVRDRAGAVVPRASVELLSGEHSWLTTTDKNGAFTFTGVLPGTYDLEVNADGFSKRTMEDLRIGSGEPDPLLVTLNVGSLPSADCGKPAVVYKAQEGQVRLKGVVREGLARHRKSLSNASVVLSRSNESTPLAAVQTNKQGEFQFADVESGRYTLKITHSRYGPILVENFRIKPGKTASVGIVFGGEIEICL